MGFAVWFERPNRLRVKLQKETIKLDRQGDTFDLSKLLLSMIACNGYSLAIFLKNNFEDISEGP